MEEKSKDTTRPWTTNQRILHDLRAIQVEIDLVKIHCIELEKIVMITMVNEEIRLHK